MFTTALILPVTFTKPVNLYLNLIYDIRSLLCHGLWSYIMLSYLVTERGQTGGTAYIGSMLNIILPLIYFPLRNKVTVGNSVSDFPLPVDSLNAPSITIP